MSVNQDCAEQMLINIAQRSLNITLSFNYPMPIDDAQLDISAAWVTSPDEQKKVWTSGKSEATLLDDLNKLDRDKTYFLRTGQNGSAGHYQMLYFDNTSNTWQSFSSKNNHYPVTSPTGKLTEQAKSNLLSQYANWGMENGQYSMLVVEASEQNIIRAANFIYDCRTKNPEDALEQTFTRELAFDGALAAVKGKKLQPADQTSTFFQPAKSDQQDKPTSAVEKKSASLPTHLIERITRQIDILNHEINSCWPYPNKDRKQIKVHALQSLLSKCEEGQNVTEAIKEIKESYPQVMAGRMSQRTATLLNDIARDTDISVPSVSFNTGL